MALPDEYAEIIQQIKNNIQLLIKDNNAKEIQPVHVRRAFDEFIQGWTEIENDLYERLGSIEEILETNDVDLDEMQEIVNYIKANKAAIEAIQEAGLGTVDDTNVNLTNSYPDFSSPTTQKRLNIKFAEKIVELEGRTFTETQTTIGKPVLENGVLKIYYTGENGNLQEQTVDLNELAQTFTYLNHVEEEISVTPSMISGSTVTLVLGQIIDPAKELSIYYNGVFIPRSMRNIIAANNSVEVDLAALNMDMTPGDFIVVKYHKKIN